MNAYIDRSSETYDLYFHEVGLMPGPDAHPTMCMSKATAEGLMQELWAHGIRPHECQYHSADDKFPLKGPTLLPVGTVELKADDWEVAAMKAHIADLRKICFHGLGIKK